MSIITTVKIKHCASCDSLDQKTFSFGFVLPACTDPDVSTSGEELYVLEQTSVNRSQVLTTGCHYQGVGPGNGPVH